MDTCKGFSYGPLWLVGQWVLVVFVFLNWIPWPAVAAHGQSSHNSSAVTEEMVVVADKIDAFVRRNPAQVESIGAREIATRNFLQVQEVLGAMPGVDVSSASGGLGTRISIRGGGGSGGVLVLIDGRPVSTMQYGGVDLSSIPIDMIERITVFKPPVPVWLGPETAAGAIYIETRTKKNEAAAKHGKVRTSGGSYGLGTVSATGQVDTAASQYLISGGASHKDGRRDNSQKEQGHLDLGYIHKDGGREIQVNGKAYITDQGIANPTYKQKPDAHQQYEKASLDVHYKGFAGDTDYTLNGWTDVIGLDETSQSGDKAKLDSSHYGYPDDGITVEIGMSITF